MKEIKLFEVRDRATRIVGVGILLVNECTNADDSLMGITGYGYGTKYLLFGRLDDGKLTWDTFTWHNNRTMQNAHIYIKKHWDDLKSGAVIDVEYILGETKKPKISDVRQSNRNSCTSA